MTKEHILGTLEIKTMVNPSVLYAECIYGYHASGYPYTKSFTIDTTKKYLIDVSMNRSGALGHYWWYIDKGEIVKNNGTQYIVCSISGDTVTVDMNNSGDWFNLIAFEIDSDSE